MKKIIAFLILLACTQVNAATYYVDFDTGDNSNTGLTGNPWKECPGTQNPTDTPGTEWNNGIAVASTVIFTSGQTWTRPILINTSYFAQPSQESQRITLTVSTENISNRAVIDLNGYSSHSYGIRIQNVDYITVRYFHIKNINASGPAAGIDIGFGNNPGDYSKVLYNKIEDVYASDGGDSYGIEVNYADGVESGYNDIQDVEEKHIEYAQTASGGSIHHNVMRNNSDAGASGNDHGIVLNGADTNIYANIIWNDDDLRAKGYAIKIDGPSDGTNADGNKIYNNVIRGYMSGIAVMDSGGTGNEIVHNTIYLRNSVGYSDLSQSALHGIRISDDTGGGAKNNVVKNNIVYYPHLSDYGGYSCMANLEPSSNESGNTISYNAFYYNGSVERFYKGGGNVAVTKTLTEMENDQYNGVNSNIMQNNQIILPTFSGGTHPVSNLPTGFDANWKPNDTGLQLTSSFMSGDSSVGATYATDIVGNARTNFNPGAYEYEAESTTVPTVSGVTISGGTF